MCDNSCLRQPCCSRGIDIQQLIVMIRFLHIRDRLLFRSGLQQCCQVPRVRQHWLLDGVVELIQRHRGRKRFCDLGDSIAQRFTVNQSVALRYSDAMNEGIFPQVVVDQWHDHPQLRQTQPRCHELWSVLQQESNHVAIFVAVRVEDVSQTV